MCVCVNEDRRGWGRKVYRRWSRVRGRVLGGRVLEEMYAQNATMCRGQACVGARGGGVADRQCGSLSARRVRVCEMGNRAHVAEALCSLHAVTSVRASHTRRSLAVAQLTTPRTCCHFRALFSNFFSFSSASRSLRSSSDSCATCTGGGCIGGGWTPCPGWRRNCCWCTGLGCICIMGGRGPPNIGPRGGPPIIIPIGGPPIIGPRGKPIPGIGGPRGNPPCPP